MELATLTKRKLSLKTKVCAGDGDAIINMEHKDG